MELYYSFSVLIVLASFFAYINYRFVKLPSTIGIMLMAIVVSLIIRFAGYQIFPETTTRLFKLISEVDFTEVLMGAMLNFLLFAGAIHVNFADLKQQRLPVLTFSTISVIISTFAIAGILYYLTPFFGVHLPFLYCLLFGALISPTDPIAVLGILKKANVSKALETKITGESLFNDGVAVVLFAVLVQLTQTDDAHISLGNISWLLAKEALGGLILGALLGYTASKALKSIDDYIVSVLITLSVVMGGYLIAHAIHISGPLTMVAAGLLIGNYGKKVAMSALTKDYLAKFWELIDEILNAILFLFIGFELLLIPDFETYWLISVATIAVVLFARFISIWIPSLIVPFKPKLSRGSLTMLVWGGLRGGVSIALVISIPKGAYNELLLEMTYFVVVFSIVVQGLTVSKVSNRVLQKPNRKVAVSEPV
ncbi:cation:proton antiporter [Adhaeribacter rhizoryzae]|uniref:Sodium:proton antiporter n=1 Tax=Adhaeribacter rhizoryzae TaxID=2607907 RepID=A0A5M6DTU0_9BACT|nr:sodium:proton antiporter [Adhaeribacter rhizoryzae]KAA5549560.1 sodium:proton antiporter [Adhaeribacter rhizoryzae]